MKSFNYNIKTYEDIKEEFPEFLRIDLSKEANLKKLLKASFLPVSEYGRVLKEEIEIAIVDREYEKYLNVCSGNKQELNANEKREAVALGKIKAAYRIVFCVDNIENQLFSAHGWKTPDNRAVLFKRMRDNNLDPLSVDEETIYTFIQKVVGGGYITKFIDGRSFRCFDAYAPLDERYSNIKKPLFSLADLVRCGP